jgi:hypothetical protein
MDKREIISRCPSLLSSLVQKMDKATCDAYVARVAFFEGGEIMYAI